jgi:hypothetical protein
MVKVKAHQGEPLNENADTQAENARQLPSEHQQWTTRTQTMTYEWRDHDGVMHVTAWSKAVRNAMLRGVAEHQMQRSLNRAVDNWIKIFMSSTDSGLQRIKQAANTGAQIDLMDSTRWRWRCMFPGSIDTHHVSLAPPHPVQHSHPPHSRTRPEIVITRAGILGLRSRLARSGPGGPAQPLQVSRLHRHASCLTCATSPRPTLAPPAQSNPA